MRCFTRALGKILLIIYADFFCDIFRFFYQLQSIYSEFAESVTAMIARIPYRTTAGIPRLVPAKPTGGI